MISRNTFYMTQLTPSISYEVQGMHKRNQSGEILL